MTGEGSLPARARSRFARVIEFLVCEPKLRLGRRRHDDRCNRCGDPCVPYAVELLDVPIADTPPEGSSSVEQLRAIVRSEYVRVCPACSVGLEEARGLVRVTTDDRQLPWAADDATDVPLVCRPRRRMLGVLSAGLGTILVVGSGVWARTAASFEPGVVGVTVGLALLWIGARLLEGGA